MTETDFYNALVAWGNLTLDEQAAYYKATPAYSSSPTGGTFGGAEIDLAARDAILACPHRGPQGALKLLEDEHGCCGPGPERTACGLGKGKRPGRVTLSECFDCKKSE